VNPSSSLVHDAALLHRLVQPNRQGIEEYQVGGHSLRHRDSGHAKVRDALPSAEGLKGRITRIRAK